MDYKDYIIAETEAATEALFRTARAMPEDKLTWHVEGKGRSALDQLQECAMTPLMFIGFLENKPEESDMIEKMKNMQATWTSIDECEQHAKANTEKLLNLIRNFPDDELETMIEIPGSNGHKASCSEIMGFQQWNLVYHRAQINFIQTLYGDSNMY
jgi:uncharacterized damage-inducible protein DinB